MVLVVVQVSLSLVPKLLGGGVGTIPWGGWCGGGWFAGGWSDGVVELVTILFFPPGSSKGVGGGGGGGSSSGGGSSAGEVLVFTRLTLDGVSTPSHQFCPIKGYFLCVLFFLLGEDT